MTAAICEQEPWLTTGGIPIVNGSVYFGIRNTDPVANPISIFSDRELLTPLTNPQPTDSYGKTVNKVWLSGQYSVEVYNSNNVLQYQDLDRGSASSESGGGVTELTTADSPYALQTTDSGLVFVVDASSGAFVFNLLGAVAAGSAFNLVVKKSSADVSANAITIDGNGAELIDGQTTFTISKTGMAVRLQCTGSILTDSQWVVDATAFFDDFIDGDKGDITVASSGATFTIKTGVVEYSMMDSAAIASVANIRASASSVLVTPDNMENAAASVALTDAATIAVDWDSGINFTVTLGGNRTLGFPTNIQAGTWRRVQVTQDGTGSRTLAFTETGYYAPGGTGPTLSTGAADVDVFYLYGRTTSIVELYTSALDLVQVA